MPGSLTEQLQNLEDIITPQSVSLWPLAIGWWVVIVVSVITIIALVIFYRRHQKKWAYRREALTLLKNYAAQSALDPDNKQTESAAAINYLECLKRTAISAYPNEHIDALYGESWLNFLNQKTPTPLFKNTLGHFICHAQYQRAFDINNKDLYQAIESWIKKHSTNYSHKPKPTIKGDTI